MNFSSDAMADFEGLLEVNRKICKQQMAEKASPTLPTNCAVYQQSASLPMIHRSPPLWGELHVRSSPLAATDPSTSSIVRRSWIRSLRGMAFSSLHVQQRPHHSGSRSVCPTSWQWFSVSGQLSPRPVDMYRSTAPASAPAACAVHGGVASKLLLSVEARFAQQHLTCAFSLLNSPPVPLRVISVRLCSCTRLPWR